MNSFLSGVLMQGLGMNMDQVIATINPFWDFYKNEREDFIDLGATTWLASMQAIDLQTTPYTWMAIPIDQNGTTVKDYIVARLSY